MPKLKYKNGSTWTELSLGAGGLNEYPIGSFYLSPMGLCNYYNGPNYLDKPEGYTCALSDFKSPASLFGGTWNKFTITYPNNGIASTVVDLSFGPQGSSSGLIGYEWDYTNSDTIYGTTIQKKFGSSKLSESELGYISPSIYWKKKQDKTYSDNIITPIHSIWQRIS